MRCHCPFMESNDSPGSLEFDSAFKGTHDYGLLPIEDAEALQMVC